MRDIRDSSTRSDNITLLHLCGNSHPPTQHKHLITLEQQILRHHSPKTVLQVNGPPDAISRLPLVPRVPLWVQVQVHVFRPRLVVIQNAKVVQRLVKVRPQLKAETVLSGDAHVEETQLLVQLFVMLLGTPGHIKGILQEVLVTLGMFRVLQGKES